MTDIMMGLQTMLLAILSIASIYAILAVIGNIVLFNKIGRNKWLGLVPILNDYILFDTFWNRNVFAIYFTVYTLYSILCVSCSANNIIVIILSIAVLMLDIMLMDRISKGFDKSFLWTIGLMLLYPVFVIILACTSEPNDEVKAKVAEHYRKKAEKKSEKETKKEDSSESTEDNNTAENSNSADAN